jgi:hypothetical protein
MEILVAKEKLVKTVYRVQQVTRAQLVLQEYKEIQAPMVPLVERVQMVPLV